MSNPNSQFVASASKRLGQYTDDRFLREYVKVGAMAIEHYCARESIPPPGNMDALKEIVTALQ